MRLQISVSWSSISPRKCGPLFYRDTEVSIEVKLFDSLNRPIRGAVVHLSGRDYTGDTNELRELLLHNKSVEQMVWGCDYNGPAPDDGVDVVEIIDPDGILAWLSLDPATLLPNDLKPRLHD